jgi:hypothetical protein
LSLNWHVCFLSYGGYKTIVNKTPTLNEGRKTMTNYSARIQQTVSQKTNARALQVLVVAAAVTWVFQAQAGVYLLGTGTINASSAGTGADLSGLRGSLENGVAANSLEGLGSGLAWAGGNTFIALPDRGPNATAYSGGSAIDNTSSYIARLQTLQLQLNRNPSVIGLPYTIAPTLVSTTLLYSTTALSYGSTAGLPSAPPTENRAGVNYFTGRSDNFAAGNSTANPNNGRFDPEAIRVSNDGKKVYIADEYGPYVREFNRNTGQLLRTFEMPVAFAAPIPNALGSVEIASNATGRVTNKGMEGLAITPDGKTLVGFIQSPLAQDGGDGGQYNRIVTIDIATGATKQFAFNNRINGKNYNSSEILAVNDHQFLVLERDGKGLGDGSPAAIKQIRLVDLTGARDVSNIFGATNLAAYAIKPSTFLDIKAILNAAGFTDDQIPAKLEGLAFGNDIVQDGKVIHTLWVVNDNDFVPTIAGPNRFFAFGFSDADLPGFEQQAISVPLPGSAALIGLGFLGFGFFRRRRAITKVTTV